MKLSKVSTPLSQQLNTLHGLFVCLDSNTTSMKITLFFPRLIPNRHLGFGKSIKDFDWCKTGKRCRSCKLNRRYLVTKHIFLPKLSRKRELSKCQEKSNRSKKQINHLRLSVVNFCKSSSIKSGRKSPKMCLAERVSSMGKYCILSASCMTYDRGATLSGDMLKHQSLLSSCDGVFNSLKTFKLKSAADRIKRSKKS